jgi:hypothetical protein
MDFKPFIASRDGPTAGRGGFAWSASRANLPIEPAPMKSMIKAILFSARPSMVDIDDARNHLIDHQELYWEVGFQIKKARFSFPLLGYIHIAGGQVEYRVTIKDILPFDASHYENAALAARVKPRPWINEWKNNTRNVRAHHWRNAFVITQIDPFSYDTKNLVMPNGETVKRPPQKYIGILPPNEISKFDVNSKSKVSISERNLEDFVVQQLDAIESGLHLVERQLHTPAGRLDLLCKDAAGNFVVVELKKSYGTDEVVGQTLRYMGWVIEKYPHHRVRGMVIVGKKDEQLRYAIKAAPGVEAKEFKLLIE